MLDTIRLGEHGIWLANLHLDLGRQRFVMERRFEEDRGRERFAIPGTTIVLRNRRFHLFMRNEGGQQYLYIWGNRHLVSPPLRHKRLLELLEMT